MGLVNATTLANRLGVHRSRITRYVEEGKLDGTFTGTGRARRFDVDRVMMALKGNLDPGQMMGNGAATKAAIKAGLSADAEQPKDQAKQSEQKEPASRRDGELVGADPDRYELARIQKAEEEARRLRRQNQEAEGQYVLASEVELQVARIIGQEIAEFETVLRDGARRIADKLGVDFKEARQILIGIWRDHRGERAHQLDKDAVEARMTKAEIEADT